MNTVVQGKSSNPPYSFKYVEDLLIWNQEYIDKGDNPCACLKQTAFFGVCGKNPEPKLYLLVYDSVVDALDPSTTYSGSAVVTIGRFVNIFIHISED